MSKKSNPGQAKKERPAKQAHSQKPGQEERSNKKPSLKQIRALKHGRKEGNDGENKPPKNKFEGGKLKDGCMPKLFMLLLPLMALGAYVLHHS